MQKQQGIFNQHNHTHTDTGVLLQWLWLQQIISCMQICCHLWNIQHSYPVSPLTVFNTVIPLVLYTLPCISREAGRTPSGSQGMRSIINGYLHKLLLVATARTYVGGDHKLCFLSATTTELVTMQVLLLLGSVSSLMTLVYNRKVSA